MGLFISLSGVINKTIEEVQESLHRFASSAQGGFEESDVEEDHPNLCVAGQRASHTTVLYPNDFVEWDDASAFLSKDLQTSVFSFHIHDEDLWMFQLFHHGELITRFNPIPDYWQEDLSEAERESWQGNAAAVSSYVPGLQREDIEKYFIRWNWDDTDEDEEELKAYPQDEFEYGDCWQLLDFMDKLSLEYPIDEEGKIHGKKYKLWTRQLKLED